jgi:hypothetical protein
MMNKLLLNNSIPIVTSQLPHVCNECVANILQSLLSLPRLAQKEQLIGQKAAIAGRYRQTFCPIFQFGGDLNNELLKTGSVHKLPRAHPCAGAKLAVRVQGC